MRQTALTIVLSLLCAVIHAADVVWFDGSHPITYSIPADVEPVVKVALDMWKSDMLQVTGMMPVASSKGVIKVVQSKGAADGFRITVKGRQIIIEGHNGRGMAYGLLELSRLAGVSPWIWWGDVVPEKKRRLTIDFPTLASSACQYYMACYARGHHSFLQDCWSKGNGR